jgi:hypothetical protein
LRPSGCGCAEVGASPGEIKGRTDPPFPAKDLKKMEVARSSESATARVMNTSFAPSHLRVIILGFSAEDGPGADPGGTDGEDAKKRREGGPGIWADVGRF